MEEQPVVEEVIPRFKTAEEQLNDEGFAPIGVEVHHSDEEVVDRLFSLGVPDEVKSVWGWAQTSLGQSSITSFAEKALKSAEEVAENVKASAEELAENVKTKAEEVVHNAQAQGLINSDNSDISKNSQSATKSGSYTYPWEPKTRFSKEIRERILRLADDSNTFLVPPPEGVDFDFDFNTNADAAMLMLEADAKLEKKRFELVPRQLSENTFWRNYFYRVELIKRSYGADEELAAQAEEVQSSNLEEDVTAKPEQNFVSEEVDAKLLDDDDSIDFETDNLSFESKKGQQENKREASAGELNWEDELEAEVDSENFDMLNDDELLDDEDADDDDLEERIKAELSLS